MSLVVRRGRQNNTLIIYIPFKRTAIQTHVQRSIKAQLFTYTIKYLYKWMFSWHISFQYGVLYLGATSRRNICWHFSHNTYLYCYKDFMMNIADSNTIRNMDQWQCPCHYAFHTNLVPLVSLTVIYELLFCRQYRDRDSRVVELLNKIGQTRFCTDV